LKPRLFTAEPHKIKNGEATDIYFQRARKILEAAELSDVTVVAETHAYSLPRGYEWGVLAGVEEVAWLLEGIPVNVYAAAEGTLFTEMEPVLAVEGRYADFAVYEPAMLGLLRHSSSVATKALRVKKAAGNKSVLFFGIRSVHPAISPAVDRAAYIGGCDAISGVVGAEMIGVNPTGTMPHALIITVGDQPKAWSLFHQLMPSNVPRIALVDTFFDERMEALMAAETLRENLHGVRLDTPSSRRGDIRKIVEEVRWTLDLNGFKHVKIYLSGGLDELTVRELRDIVDGFGVGTSIAFPQSVDLALDIVERNGKPVSKRGKLPGRKQVYRCENFHDIITAWDKQLSTCPTCSAKTTPLLKPLIKNGVVVGEIPDVSKIRDYVLEQLSHLEAVGGLIRPMFYL